MAFKMGFSTEELKGPEPVAAGLYEVRFVGFKVALSKKGDSFNYNASVEIIDPPVEKYQSKVYVNLNSQIPNWIQDFVHSFGLEMEFNPDTEKSDIPGDWDGDSASFDPNKLETYKYEGPLTGKTAIWELVPDKDLNGKPRTSANRFICAVPNCAQKFPEIQHAMKMVKSA